MRKSKKILILLMLGMVLGWATIASGCSVGGGQSADTKKDAGSNAQQEEISNNAIFELYNMVDIGDKKASVENALGATGDTAAEGSYVYVDPETNYAVNVFYDAKDLVTLKVLIPTTGARELIELSNATVTKEDAVKITKGMTLGQVKKALTGVGLEMLRMINPSKQEKQAYALAWINTDGSILVVTFDADTDTVLSAEFKDSLL